MSNSVALVKKGVVCGGEAGILKEQATLQALPLQGGVLLPLEGLHWSEHTAGPKEHNQVTPLFTLWTAHFIKKLDSPQKCSFLHHFLNRSSLLHVCSSTWHTADRLEYNFNTLTINVLSENQKSMCTAALSTAWIPWVVKINPSMHWKPQRTNYHCCVLKKSCASTIIVQAERTQTSESGRGKLRWCDWGRINTKLLDTFSRINYLNQLIRN